MNPTLSHQSAELEFDIQNPSVPILFSKQLNNNRQSSEFKFFQESGLVGPGSLTGTFPTAIGTVELQGAGEFTFYLRTFKGGEPITGDYTPLTEKSGVRERLPEKCRTVHLVMDQGEQVGTPLTSSMLQAPVFIDIMQTIDEWRTALDAELYMCTLGAMRGINDGYEAYNDVDKQAEIDFGDFDTASAANYYRKYQGHLTEGETGYQAPDPDAYNAAANKNLPSSLKQIDKSYNDIVQPHRKRHIAAWQTKDEMLKHHAINYKTAAATDIDIVTFCNNIHTWISKRTRARDGVSWEPASVNIPSTLKENRAYKTLPKQIVMVVNEDVANDIRASQSWQDHQGDLIQAHGLDTGLTNAYLGQFSKVILFTSDMLPRFKVKGVANKTFTRGFIFGKESMIVARNSFKIPMQYAPDRKSPGTLRSKIANVNYTLWIDELNRKTDSEVLASTTFGCKVIQYPLPGSGAKEGEDNYQTRDRYNDSERICRGRIVVDWLEGSHDA